MSLYRLLVIGDAFDYRHESIAAGIGAVVRAAHEADTPLRVCCETTACSSAREQPGWSDEWLSSFRMLVFVSNSGEILDAAQKAMVLRWVKGETGDGSKRSLLGIHSCTAAFLDGRDASGDRPLGTTWEQWGLLWGARFVRHPPPCRARLCCPRAELDRCRMQQVPEEILEWHDEFYEWDRHPFVSDGSSGNLVRAVAFVDPRSYEGSTASSGEQHPLVWTYETATLRVMHNALFHFRSSFDTQIARDMIRGGIEWCILGDIN